MDVFAPGVNIYSTTTGGNSYESLDGTSMASPVVAGLAALLRSYFPELTASETKSIIIQTASHPLLPSQRSGNAEETIEKLCVSGGIANAFNAVKLAYEFTRR